MPFIDTHAHIYLEEFDADRLNVVERAEKEGVGKILLPAVDSSTHMAMLRAEEGFPGLCFSMMGVHPCSVKENFEEELELARGWLEKRAFLAVGEIGLDFYWDLTFKEEQFLAFNRQVEWALDYNIPIVIHSRNSIDECIRVVSDHQNGKLRGVFHCFSGNLVQARQIMDLGFFLGIGGVLTFKNSGLDRVMQEISLDHVLLETDSPYLAPVPFRGKRNECAYIKYVAEKLGEIKNLTVEEVGEVTTKNAVKLFGELS